MCLVVSSSRLLLTFYVFSFKWVLISILIWNGFIEHQNRKNLRSVLATEHAKLGLVKNCLNSIMHWLANVTILLFTWTFETWYFCFSRKAKGILHDPFVELFFCKKIPLSRRVGYVMDGSVSEWWMYVCHTNQIGSTINSPSNFFF